MSTLHYVTHAYAQTRQMFGLLFIISDYPDAIAQIVQLFKSPRCGDIVISAETGYDLRKDYEYPEHKSSHGSLKREHMVVPLIINKKIKGSVPQEIKE